KVEILVAHAGPRDIASSRSTTRNWRIRVRSYVSTRATVTLKFLPDLQQQGAAVVGILLYDSIPIAADPNVVLVIDITAVHAVRQDGVLSYNARCSNRWRRSGGNQRRIAPCIDHVAGGIELDHRRGRFRFERATQCSCARVRATDAF